MIDLNWDALGAIAELIGAIAIIVTLIYLTIQLKQESASVKAATFQSASQGRTSLRVALMTDSNLRLAVTKLLAGADEDNFDSGFAAHVYLVEEFRIAQAAYYLHQRDLADMEFWHHERHMLHTYKMQPGFEAWWEKSGMFYYTQEFVEEVDRISNVPLDVEAEYMVLSESVESGT